MSLLDSFLIVVVYVFYLCKIYECCPTDYLHCATQSNECGLANPSVIAYGADGFRWAYKLLNVPFICENSAFGGDSVIDITKECCYQSPQITELPAQWTWSAGHIACNQRIYAYISSNIEIHIWKFITTAFWTVTFSDCDSAVSDTQMHLFDDTGKDITSGSCTGCQGVCTDICESCNGDDCGFDCTDGEHEEYTYPNLPTGTYYIQFTPFDGSGNYEISVTCDAAPNYQYDTNILTCDDNSISSVTSAENTKQFFQVNLVLKQDITFESCGSSYDTQLHIYSDSLYEEPLIGGDNDLCTDEPQERYQLNALEPGSYYVELATSDACAGVCYGSYTVSISCNGYYTTLSPTMLTSIPTHPSVNPIQPSLAPTFMTINPSMTPTTLPTVAPSLPSGYPTIVPMPKPTLKPTVAPTLSPTSKPSESSLNPTSGTTHATLIPSQYPTISPLYYPTATPSKYPSSSPTYYPSLTPTKYPTSIAPSKYPSVSPTYIATYPPTLSRPLTKKPSNNPIGKQPPLKQGEFDSESSGPNLVVVAVIIGAAVCYGICILYCIASCCCSKNREKYHQAATELEGHEDILNDTLNPSEEHLFDSPTIQAAIQASNAKKMKPFNVNQFAGSERMMMEIMDQSAVKASKDEDIKDVDIVFEQQSSCEPPTELPEYHYPPDIGSISEIHTISDQVLSDRSSSVFPSPMSTS